MQEAPGSNAKTYGNEAPGALQYHHSDEGINAFE